MTANHAPTLAAFAERLQPLMEQQRAVAEMIREVMSEMRDAQLNGGILKQWMAAIIDADVTGKDGKLKRLMAKTQDAAIYADMLGYQIDGFGMKRSVPEHDLVTGEVRADA